jgi:hypothetical protein
MNQVSRVKNITVSQNRIDNRGGISFTPTPLYVYNATPVVVNNNIIKTDSTAGTVFSCELGEVLISNNSFNYGKATFASTCSGEASSNIFNGYTKAETSPVNIHDNYDAASDVLEQQVYTWTGSDDAKFQLRDDSLAIGACNGADCGAFAGTTPYILSGLPPRPRITNLVMPASVLQTDTTMQVTVSAESRN